jgi:hypothetical protein
MNGPAHAAPSSSHAHEVLEREVDEAVAICGGDKLIIIFSLLLRRAPFQVG